MRRFFENVLTKIINCHILYTMTLTVLRYDDLIVLFSDYIKFHRTSYITALKRDMPSAESILCMGYKLVSTLELRKAVCHVTALREIFL